MADSTFEQHQVVPIQIMATDGRGNAVKFVHIPIWTCSDETVLKVAVAPDGLSAMASGQSPGIADITVTADGLNGIWNVEITGPRIIFQTSAPIG